MGEPITIVGAGPAGLTAAIVLARNGLPVRVFEMAPEVGHRLNGDFQGFENWSSERDVTELLREIGLDLNSFGLDPFDTATIDVTRGTGNLLWLYPNDTVPNQVQKLGPVEAE